MSGSSFYNAPKAIKKTRKPHVCAYCGKAIPKGTPHIIKESGLWMGDFWKRYSCRDCQPYISEFWGWQGCESSKVDYDDLICWFDGVADAVEVIHRNLEGRNERA